MVVLFPSSVIFTGTSRSPYADQSTLSAKSMVTGVSSTTFSTRSLASHVSPAIKTIGFGSAVGNVVSTTFNTQSLLKLSAVTDTFIETQVLVSILSLPSVKLISCTLCFIKSVAYTVVPASTVMDDCVLSNR